MSNQRDPRAAERVYGRFPVDTVGRVTAAIKFGEIWYLYRPIERVEIDAFVVAP
jgi:hypothetical protein